jgi:Methyltransferase FkbM domain
MLKNLNARRFTLLQIVLVCVLSIGGGGLIARYRYRATFAAIDAVLSAGHPESQSVKAKYGPHRNSYSEEEWLSRNSLLASADKSFTEQFGDTAKEVEVPTITLNDLLDSERVKKIDFMSIDIELWEPKALAGFDVERFHPELVCIEAHPQVRPQILDYFARHHYTVVGKYLRADVNNVYFTPLS